ncbi:MAG: hypothetical protein IKS48_14355 [Eubacterium sp.]|nr:hypothetical protein [Eubacterium sp.]
MKKRIKILTITAMIVTALTACASNENVADSKTEELTEVTTEEQEITDEEEKIADKATEAIMDEIKKITDEAQTTDNANTDSN